MCIRDRQYCFFMSEGDLLAALEKLHALQAKHDEKERNLHDLAKKMSELHYMHQEADEENRRLTKQLNAVRSEFESKDTQLKQVLKEKELTFSKLQTCERENDRLQRQLGLIPDVKQPAGTASGGGFLSFIFGGGGGPGGAPQHSATPPSNHGATQPLSGLSVRPANNSYNSNPNSGYKPPIIPFTSDSSAEPVEDDDILNRIRQNLNLNEGSADNSHVFK
eukprot:TRINITY_DN1339_c0_g2_i6.p1 TRINITY_DN1339_c0_g2~~TRINITY_DN1339_c0_g2_i6.p1  ORF type:complete len:221 (+),score=44.32 TRINITY_DN1339_c0_g2_i6:65-727(+)